MQWCLHLKITKFQCSLCLLCASCALGQSMACLKELSQDVLITARMLRDVGNLTPHPFQFKILAGYPTLPLHKKNHHWGLQGPQPQLLNAGGNPS